MSDLMLHLEYFYNDLPPLTKVNNYIKVNMVIYLYLVLKKLFENKAMGWKDETGTCCKYHLSFLPFLRFLK